MAGWGARLCHDSTATNQCKQGEEALLTDKDNMWGCQGSGLGPWQIQENWALQLSSSFLAYVFILRESECACMCVWKVREGIGR